MSANSLTEIRPVDDRLVPDPQSGDTLPKEGRKVVMDQYWNRRLRDGDISIINQTPPKRGKSDN